MIHVGSEVGWIWGSSITTGIVLEIHNERHEIISKGKRIVRNGSKEDPAIVIKHTKGSLVLKLAHEVNEISQSKK